MSERFVSKSTPDLDKQILSAQSVEDIREAVKNHLAATGVIRLERGQGIGERVVEQEQSMQPSPALSIPESSGMGSAYRVIYPHGNDRYELFGADENELDAKENAIRAMYQGR